MQKTGTSFLHEKNPSFHASTEVETVAGYLRVGGESIPNAPTDKLRAYLGFVANKEYVNDGILTGDERSVDRQVEAASVSLTEENANAYVKFQAKVARELGRGGEIDVDTMDRRTKMDALRLVRKDQQKQLHDWVNELNDEHNKYPDWYKYWMFESVKRHTAFNDDTDKHDRPKGFEKRSRSSFALFPELDRESVSLVYEALVEKLGGQAMGFEYNDMRALLHKAQFSELYTEAQNYGYKITDELKAVTTGTWHDFEQSDHRDDAEALSELIRSYRTGWCTAGAETAAVQLSNGDFYVWCSTNPETGQDEVPRIAVRMEQGVVAEVRGIVGGKRQELESELSDTVMDKIAHLPGGESYFKKAMDMKRLTAIEKRLAIGQDIAREDLLFLYEINGEIEGFGNDKDPRVEEIRDTRSWLVDTRLMSGEDTETGIAMWILNNSNNQNFFVSALWEKKLTHLDKSVALYMAHNILGEVSALAENINVFQGLTYDELAKAIIAGGNIQDAAWNITKFRDLSIEVAETLMAHGKLEALYYGSQAFTDLSKVDIRALVSGMSAEDQHMLERVKDCDREAGYDSTGDYDEDAMLSISELKYDYGIDPTESMRNYDQALLAAARMQRNVIQNTSVH